MERRIGATKVAGACALVLMLGACLKTEEFPVEPALKLKTFQQQGDTIQLAVDFTDGDGDIGLGEGDTLAPYQRTGEYYYNLYCDFQIFHNGSWGTAQSDWNYRIPVITPTGQNKALDGTINVAIGPFPGPRPFPLPAISAGDTLRATVKLYDRALHQSNVITTDRIILQ